MNRTKNKTWVIAGTTILVATVCGLIAFLIFSLTAERRTDTLAEAQSEKMMNLTCDKTGSENEFFNKESQPIDGKHEIRANFNNNDLTDLLYTFMAVYSNGTDLTHLKDVAEANFNLAYGNTYRYKENLWSVSFTTDSNNSSIKMSIYAGSSGLESNVAKVFQLERGNSFPKTLDSMKSAYEAAGFRCNVSK